ncbi:DUF1963 domain-containing protein [Nocardiopsis baichengensis]|uniref:DUF1963 domain-containing protein n=1 Tax=Nocardiopsis baichengensis TaxID=280240 RepID=UPI00034C8A9F|nr:DUF1963 domain-containing protein [Nocardiopsis baichengensis]
MTVDDLRTLHLGRLVPAEGTEGTEDGPVTRLGGQPDWLGAPEWPVSGGFPLRFIAQVRMPGPEPRIAYIFMDNDRLEAHDPDPGDLSAYDWNTDAPSSYYVTDSHAPNTVIVQPGGTPRVPTAPVAEGPTLYTTVSGEGRKPVEFRVELTPYELDAVPDAEEDDEDAAAWWSGDVEYEKDADGGDGRPDVQVGGPAFWLQMDEAPGDDWHHLATIDSATDKYSINCGDSGLAYALLNPERTNGVLIVQSC